MKAMPPVAGVLMEMAFLVLMGSALESSSLTVTVSPQFIPALGASQ
jgi:hypothetical protein